MEKLGKVDLTALVLLIIGGINWGLIGLFDFDLVATVFGDMSSALSRIIYTVVGLSVVYIAVLAGSLKKE